MTLLLLLAACNGGKDSGDDCYDLTDYTTCAAVGLSMAACCTDDDVCLVGVRTDGGEKPGYDSICYDGIESVSCAAVIDDLESYWCQLDSGQ